MTNKLRPSQLEVLYSGDLNGNEFFTLHRIGYNYSLTLGELKKYIGTGGSGGGSDIDLTSVPSNIIPDSNGSRILGNAENAWKRLFLTDSIVFSGGRGSINGDLNVIGALNVKGAAVAMQSSIDRINGIVDDMDVRLLKVEQGGAVVDLSDYYTKHDADNKFVNISVLNNYVSVRGDHTITGTHTYQDGKLKVGQWAFGAGSSGITIDGGLIQTSLNSYTNSDIDNMIASVSTASKLGGMLNITDKTAIQNAQKSLTSTNQVAYYIITDSSGKLPSKQTCFDLSADNIKQLSLTSPNALTNAALSLVHGRVAVSPIGVNVGDMIAITRVKVKVDDLTATLGVSLSLSGEIEIYQYRIISFNDAKAPNTNGIANGVMGLMTPSDKAEVSKIGGIERTANHVRDNYLPKADLLPSIWGTNMNDCLSTGVYPWCTLGRPSGSTGAYTCIVKRTSTNDGSYDTIEQTAYGREGELGRVFKRIIFQHKDGSDTQYGDWIELGGGSGSGDNSGIVDGVYNKKLTINSGEDPVVLRLTNNDKGSATKILIQFGDICTLGYNADAGGFQLNGKIVATLNDIPKDYVKKKDIPSFVGTPAIEEVTTALTGKWYSVRRDSNGNLIVQVPWTDTDTKYTLPAASSSALGGIKTGYSANGKNYPVQLDANNKAYVNVPWTDTNTHPDLTDYATKVWVESKNYATKGALNATDAYLDQIAELATSAYTLADDVHSWGNHADAKYAKSDDTLHKDTAGTNSSAITIQSPTNPKSDRWYPIQLSTQNKKLVVNVPWTDTDTKYTLSVASSSALGGIKIGYSANGKNYPVQLDANNKAYVNVPWEKGISDLSNYYDKDDVDSIVSGIEEVMESIAKQAEDNQSDITNVEKKVDGCVKDGDSIGKLGIGILSVSKELKTTVPVKMIDSRGVIWELGVHNGCPKFNNALFVQTSSTPSKVATEPVVDTKIASAKAECFPKTKGEDIINSNVSFYGKVNLSDNLDLIAMLRYLPEGAGILGVVSDKDGNLQSKNKIVELPESVYKNYNLPQRVNVGDYILASTHGCKILSTKSNKESVTYTQEYYDEGNGQVVPVKHPDIATQPNILPYKLAGNYVYEQLLYVGSTGYSIRDGNAEFSMDAPEWEIESPCILKATLITSNGDNGNQVSAPCIASKNGNTIKVCVGKNFVDYKGSISDAWLLIEYSSFSNLNRYYGYGEDDGYDVTLEFYLSGGTIPLPLSESAILYIGGSGIAVSGKSKVKLTKDQIKILAEGGSGSIRTGEQTFRYLEVIVGSQPVKGTSVSTSSFDISINGLKNYFGSFGIPDGVYTEKTTLKFTL